MLSEDGADCCVGDLVAKVGQRALDAVVTPGPILAGHAQGELDDSR